MEENMAGSGKMTDEVAIPAAPLEALTVQEPVEEAAADLVVPFKIDLDSEISATMVQALVKYLLYLRGQIPCVYDEFYGLVRRQQCEEEAARMAGTRKRKLISGSTKKARKLVNVTDQVLEQSLPAMFQRRVRTVAIVFGSTVASPRELWRIDFCGPSPGQESREYASVQGKAGTELARERVVQLCVQKIIRTVLSYVTQHFSSSVSVTSIHLLVFAAKSDVPVEGFVPKQQLRLRLPKARREGNRTHIVQITHRSSKESSNETEETVDEDDDRFMWYQSIRPLQGVSRLS